MPNKDVINYLIPPEILPELSELFDEYQFAIEPNHQSAKDAEIKFFKKIPEDTEGDQDVEEGKDGEPEYFTDLDDTLKSSIIKKIQDF